MYTGRKWNKVNTSETNELASNESRLKAIENRRSFIPEIVNNRHDTGINHPPKALLIMGHGNEGWKLRVPFENGDSEEILRSKFKDRIPDLIPVPKGSIVVIKSHSGNITYDKDAMRNYINTLLKENEHIILDPIKYIDDITRIFGSVAIYREGDLCPNITHAYISDFNFETHFVLEPSGTVSIPLLEDMNSDELQKYIQSKVQIPKTMTIKEYKIQRDSGGFSIEEQLKLSTNSKGEKSLIINFLVALDDTDENSTFGEVFETLLGNKSIKQEQIFKSRPNTITYAFNCRYIDNHEKLVPEHVRLGANSNNLKKMIINTSNQAIGPINIGFRRYKNSGTNLISNRKRVSSVAPEIKQQVSESIQQRRLGALALSRNKTEKDKLRNYKASIDSSPINNSNTLGDKMNKVSKYYPELKDYYINSTLKKASYDSRLNIINKLNTRYSLNKNKLNRTYKNIINRQWGDNNAFEDGISKLNNPEITNYYLNSKLKYPNINSLNRLITKFPTRKNKVEKIRNNLLQQQQNLNNSAYDEYIGSKLLGMNVSNINTIKYNKRFQTEKEEQKKKYFGSYKNRLNKNNISDKHTNVINNYILFLKTNPDLIEDSRPILQKILDSSINEEIKNKIREILTM